MKTINIALLKSQLSHFLKLVRKGERVVVKDRDEPIAELIPYKAEGVGRERLIREGKIIASSRELDLSFSPVKKGVTIQKLLDETREDR